MKLKTGKSVSIPKGLGLSLAGNVIITAITITILASLLNNTVITWEETGYWIMGMLLVASFVGSKLAIMTIKTQRYLIGLMSGILFWAFLLCITALFFGGQYCSIPETGVLIISGSITAALIQFPKNRIFRSNTHHSYR